MSNVYFTNLHTKPGNGLTKKLERLIKKAGIEQLPAKGLLTAIKIHFGELGNMAFLRHNYAETVAHVLTQMGAKPFLTDSNTLYTGSRSNAVDHLRTATLNGFNQLSVPSAPVVIADGLKGLDEVVLPLPEGEFCKEAKIGSALAQADVIVSLSHFKGHEQTTFGGALKNLGMGSASVSGKLHLHCDGQPTIYPKLCVGCGQCIVYCKQQAITLDSQRKAVINQQKCVGCGQCIAVCQKGAAAVAEYNDARVLSGRISEYAYALLKGKPHFHIALIMNVSPLCDCWDHNDTAVVPDLGMLASFDPVALDSACAHLVTQATGYNAPQGVDKFLCLHPHTDGAFGLEHAEKLGLGTRAYKLIEV